MLASSSEFDLLLTIGITIFAALGFSVLFSKLKLPVVIGQLLAGMIVGPFGLGLVQDINSLNLLASLGIILLLFTVGLELDPAEILRVGGGSLLLALVEFSVTFLSVFTVGILVGLGYLGSVFAGVIVSTTSTAIMGKLLIESKSLRASESHLVLTASVIEDFATVFILLLLPGLVVANSKVPITDVELFVVKGLILVGVILAFGWKAAPILIQRVGGKREENQETAFLLALSFGFAFAILSSYLGFSPAVGAFLMGLMIRGNQARFISDKIGPIKDLFVVLFFVSMGTLINIGALVSVTFPIVAIVSMAILGKFVGAWAGAKLSRVGSNSSRVGVSMLPRGEFSFIVAREGTGLSLASQVLYPLAGLATLVSSLAASVGLRLLRPRSIAQPAELLSRPIETPLEPQGLIPTQEEGPLF